MGEINSESEIYSKVITSGFQSSDSVLAVVFFGLRASCKADNFYQEANVLCGCSCLA